MPIPIFDLPEIFACIRRQKRLLMWVTVCTAIAGGLFYLLSTPKYEARADFLLRNPLYSDRNNLYNYDGKFIDYFANEDDLNRVVAMSGSAVVQNKVILDMNLAQAYKIDTTKNGGMHKVRARLNKNLNLIRTENKIMSLAYVDTDPVRAAAVANHLVEILEENYNGFFKEMRMSMYQTVMDKVHYEDSAIKTLTDSLIVLRQQYGIYEIISPTRHNIMLSGSNKAGSKEYAAGIEAIQNIESVKDEMVSDRAMSITLANQYASGIGKGQMNMIKVITPATPPLRRAGIGGLFIVLSSAIVGFLFCLLVILVRENFPSPAEK